MKRIFLSVLAVAAGLAMTSCDFLADLLDEMLDGGDEDVVYVDKWADMIDETSKDCSVDGPTLTYGNHKYTIVTELDPETTEYSRATASVTFTNIPSGYTEFAAVYNGLLGKSLAGTAAMIPMAMEIYARDADTGKKCIDLLCTTGAAGEFVTELRRKIIPSKYSGETDSYIQRYIPAALLKGATPAKAYAPDAPYTVEMTMTSNGVKHNNQENGDVTYMCIVTSGGWSSAQRGVDIFQVSGSTMYKVFSCPSCYTQCQQIQGSWAGLK